jgi:hypothetical protein
VKDKDEYQNVTVALPARLVEVARHLAVDRGLSLSVLVAKLIEEQLESRRHYEVMRERALKALKEGYPFALGDNIPWTRDELHER